MILTVCSIPKQEWMKTRAEMNEVFGDVPEALGNTVDICDRWNIIPSTMHLLCLLLLFLKISERKRVSAEILRRRTCLMSSLRMKTATWCWSRRRRPQSQDRKLGGYDKLYRIKLEATIWQIGVGRCAQALRQES